MNARGYNRSWRLHPGELVQLNGARGTRLKVTRGKLWVTLEHDLRDIVLEAGASFTIDRGGLTLVESQGDSRVCVDPHYVHSSAVYRGVSALWSRMTRWIDRVIASAASRRRFVPYY